MKLSSQANKYVIKLKRDKDYIVERNDVVSYLTKNSIPSFEKVIDFAIDFSGLELSIIRKPLSTFFARLFSQSDIQTNTSIEHVIIDGHYYFDCGEHRTSQFWFVLSDTGQLCTYNNNDETVNVISSSFNKFIETYAFEDLLSQNNKYEEAGYHDLLDESKFEAFIKDYQSYLQVNDEYNRWLSYQTIIIQKGTWLDRPKSFIHIYGDDKEQCESFAGLLRDESIIE